MRTIVIWFALFYYCINANAQTVHWYFGDKAGIIFQNGIALPDTNGMLISTEASASFDFPDGTFLYTNGYRCWDHNHQLIENSDSIFKFPPNVWNPFYDGNTIMNGVSILQFPNKLFVVAPNPYGNIPGYEYIKKGIFIYEVNKINDSFTIPLQDAIKLIDFDSIKVIESIAVTKHGNGRDWWLLTHLIDSSNTFIKFLITPDTIYRMPNQKLGSLEFYIVAANGQTLFNKSGTKLYMSHASGLIDVFNFNRCTGELTNFANIKSGTFNPGTYYKEAIYGMSVSPDGSKIYASGWKRLIQYGIDTNSNLLITQDTVWNNPYYPTYPYCYNDTNCVLITQHQLGPNGRIYIAHFPYFINGPSNNDTILSYLSVISNSNAQGALCNFQPFSFSLLGQKSRFCLPNNPNYNLGPLAGSPCDTLSTSTENKPERSMIRVYPNPAREVLNIEILNNLKLNSLTLLTLSGTELMSLTPTRSLTQLNLRNIPPGFYLLRIVHADGTVQVRKVVKQ